MVTTHVDESVDPTAPALGEPVAERRDEPPTVEEREVAAEPSDARGRPGRDERVIALPRPHA